MSYILKHDNAKKELARRFSSLMRNLTYVKNKPHDVTINFYFEQIVRSYSDPVRWYHTLFHLLAMFEVYDTVKKKLAEPELVELAIWFHDIIYVPGSTENEKASARYARDVLTTLGCNEKDISTVLGLITIGTSHPKDPNVLHLLTKDQRYISDIDLEGFSRSFDAVLQASYNLRREFAQFDDDTFYKGQSEFLMSLHARRIYLTDAMSVHERTAKENIFRTIGKLREVVRARPTATRL